jgi:hypothetical protein
MTRSARLLARLREVIDLPEGAYLERTRASRGQVAAGAWRWRVMLDGTFYSVQGGAIGSQETMAEVLAAEKIAVYHQDRSGDWVIYIP